MDFGCHDVAGGDILDCAVQLMCPKGIVGVLTWIIGCMHA